MPKKMKNAFEPAVELMTLVAKGSENGIDFANLKKGIELYQAICQESLVVRQTTSRSHRNIANEFSAWFDNNRNVTPEMVFKKATDCLTEGKVKESGIWGKSVLYQLLIGYTTWYEKQRAVNTKEIIRLYKQQLADKEAIIAQQNREIEQLRVAKEPLQKQAHNAQLKLNEATRQVAASQETQKSLAEELHIAKKANSEYQQTIAVLQADRKIIGELQRENERLHAQIAQVTQERNAAQAHVNKLLGFLLNIKKWLKTTTFSRYFTAHASTCAPVDNLLNSQLVSAVLVDDEASPRPLLHSEKLASLPFFNRGNKRREDKIASVPTHSSLKLN